MSVAKKRGLGKGLDALLSVGQESSPDVAFDALIRPGHQLPLEWLRPDLINRV